MSRGQFILLTALTVVGSLIGGAVLSALFKAENVSASPGEKIIEAQAFVLVDENGNHRGEWTMDEHGVYFGLFDQNHRSSIQLRSGDIEALLIYDENKRVRIALSLEHNKMPNFSMWDKNRKSGIGLSLTTEDDSLPFIAFYKNGHSNMFLNASPCLILYDENQKKRTELGVTKIKSKPTGSTEVRPPSSLVLYDEQENVIWIAP